MGFIRIYDGIPSGKRLHNYGNSERSTMLLMGKSTISMAIFNSYVTNDQRVYLPTKLGDFVRANVGVHIPYMEHMGIII